MRAISSRDARARLGQVLDEVVAGLRDLGWGLKPRRGLNNVRRPLALLLAIAAFTGGCGPDVISGYEVIITNDAAAAVRVQFGGHVVYDDRGMALSVAEVSAVIEPTSEGAVFVSVGELDDDWTRSVDIYDLACNRLARLSVGPGLHAIRWDGTRADLDAVSVGSSGGRLPPIEAEHCP